MRLTNTVRNVTPRYYLGGRRTGILLWGYHTNIIDQIDKYYYQIVSPSQIFIKITFVLLEISIIFTLVELSQSKVTSTF